MLGISIPSIASSTFQDLGTIRNTATDFVKNKIINKKTKNRVEVEANQLDHRLRLSACHTPLKAKRLSGQRKYGNTTISIRCSGPKPWTVHVPVTVKAYTNVVIVNRPLNRHTPINAEDVTLEERDISSLRSGFFEHLDDVIGRHPKRTLIAGSALSPKDVDSQKIIRQGNSVTIVAKMQGITVRVKGKALGNAAKGESITVRNLSSQRKIEAIAIAPGIVEVPM